MAGLRMDKPWTELSTDEIAALPAQLGVYQLADAEGRIVKIGYAGGKELFGLRSVLEAALGSSEASQFRTELTHGYLSRWEELLMVHHAEYGELPPGNRDHPHRLGRLTVDTINPATITPATTDAAAAKKASN